MEFTGQRAGELPGFWLIKPLNISIKGRNSFFNEEIAAAATTKRHAGGIY